MKKVLIPCALAVACGLALAKLPAPDDAAKAKAAETAAKAAWQGKVDAFQLCKAQDRVAAAHKKTSGTKPAAAASAAGATAAVAPCADPGPFVYAPQGAASAPAPAAPSSATAKVTPPAKKP